MCPRVVSCHAFVLKSNFTQFNVLCHAVSCFVVIFLFKKISGSSPTHNIVPVWGRAFSAMGFCSASSWRGQLPSLALTECEVKGVDLIV